MAIDRNFIKTALLSIQEKICFNSMADAIDTVVTVPNVTASTAEMNTLTGQAASFTAATTPATGSCAVQFVFKDAQGVTLSHAITGSAYFSNSTGLAFAAATSGATLTNGAWLDTVAGKTAEFITSAAGLLGVTVTAATGTYYIAFQLPNGKIVVSSAIVCN